MCVCTVILCNRILVHRIKTELNWLEFNTLRRCIVNAESVENKKWLPEKIRRLRKSEIQKQNRVFNIIKIVFVGVVWNQKPAHNSKTSKMVLCDTDLGKWFRIPNFWAIDYFSKMFSTIRTEWEQVWNWLLLCHTSSIHSLALDPMQNLPSKLSI